MAQYNVTAEATALLAAGWTTEQIVATHPRIVQFHDRWEAQNRAAEQAITAAAARAEQDAARAQALTDRGPHAYR